LPLHEPNQAQFPAAEKAPPSKEPRPSATPIPTPSPKLEELFQERETLIAKGFQTWIQELENKRQKEIDELVDVVTVAPRLFPIPLNQRVRIKEIIKENFTELSKTDDLIQACETLRQACDKMIKFGKFSQFTKFVKSTKKEQFRFRPKDQWVQIGTELPEPLKTNLLDAIRAIYKKDFKEDSHEMCLLDNSKHSSDKDVESAIKAINDLANVLQQYSETK
jgi:hypothetical protein